MSTSTFTLGLTLMFCLLLLALLSSAFSPSASRCEAAGLSEAPTDYAGYELVYLDKRGHMDLVTSEMVIDSSLSTTFKVRIFSGEYDNARSCFVHEVWLLNWDHGAHGHPFEEMHALQEDMVDETSKAMRKGLVTGRLLVDNQGRTIAEAGEDESPYGAQAEQYIALFGRYWAAPSPGDDSPYREGAEFTGDGPERPNGWFEQSEPVLCSSVKVWKDGRTEVVLNSSIAKHPVPMKVGSEERQVTIPPDKNEWVLTGSPLLHDRGRASFYRFNSSNSYIEYQTTLHRVDRD